jgi:hypothetical protein
MMTRVKIPEDDLIVIDKELLVERYNTCLEDMGLPRTQLHKFRIDRMGWSPEIAKKMKNVLYLSHGEANPLAIILTPDQRYTPIAYGYHSFDHAMMEKWFEKFEHQIIEMTKYTGIWLDIDQDVPVYQDPEDLLMVTEVIVRANTPNHMMSRAYKQTHYARNIIRTDDLMEIEENAQKLCTSVKEIGDMRGKDVQISDMKLPINCTYFTRAFGGTFVLCNGEKNDANALILNKGFVSQQNGVTSSIDRNVLHSLEELGLISYDLLWWTKNVSHIRIVRESFLMEIFDRRFPELDISELNQAEKKKLINQVQTELPEEYCKLSHAIHKLEDGRIDIEVDESIHPFFAFPSVHLEEWVRDVIWHLLVLVCDGRRIDCLYVYDREEFKTLYQSWATPRRTWANQIIYDQEG